MQCGGSDAWSALTANPALGVASDYLVALGGTSLLGETPEIYGAEQMLVDRVVDPADGDRILDRIRWWERYTSAAGTTLDGNPSPGNKAGGITTILEKSLGSVAKGGQSPVAGYLDYAEACDGRAGLLFMDTPGFDPVSATGMVAGGANLVCFTTGRGSVFGSKPAPTVKLATNAALAAAHERRHGPGLLRRRRAGRPDRGDGPPGLRPAARCRHRAHPPSRSYSGSATRSSCRGRSEPCCEPNRLSTATLRAATRRWHSGRRRCRSASSVTSAPSVGIIHLGIGAFHRAHQAIYTQEAMAAAGESHWGIAGVTQRSASVQTQLAPQDGLYGVLESAPGTHPAAARPGRPRGGVPGGRAGPARRAVRRPGRRSRHADRHREGLPARRRRTAGPHRPPRRRRPGWWHAAGFRSRPVGPRPAAALSRLPGSGHRADV